MDQKNQKDTKQEKDNIAEMGTTHKKYNSTEKDTEDGKINQTEKCNKDGAVASYVRALRQWQEGNVDENELCPSCMLPLCPTERMGMTCQQYEEYVARESGML